MQVAEFPTTGRKLLLASLVSMLVLQASLVYTDQTGRRLAPLSEEAQRGREIWLENNCQACHQFYGFGGFLGPDLTNASGRLTRARLDAVLAAGIAQMPAFELSEESITAVESYLREIDRTGVGQARVALPDQATFNLAIRDIITGDSTSAVSRGSELFILGSCTGCHAALAPRRIGTYVAPDLSHSATAMSDRDILTTLESGRTSLGMPPSGLTLTQREDMLAFLRWLTANRDLLLDQTTGGEGGLPWWEFR